MLDMRAHLEKLRIEAEECEIISKLATNVTKKELFAKLATHFRTLAGEVEWAISDIRSSLPEAALLPDPARPPELPGGTGSGTVMAQVQNAGLRSVARPIRPTWWPSWITMRSFAILSLDMKTFWSSPPAQYRLLLFPGTVSGSSSGPERRAQPRVLQAIPGRFDSARVMDKQPTHR